MRRFVEGVDRSQRIRQLRIHFRPHTAKLDMLLRA